MNVTRLGFGVIYRLKLAPWDAFGIDRGLIELAEGRSWTAPGKALDIGCGTGRNSIYLAQHGWDVTGLDLVSYAIAKARRNARKAGVQVRLLQGDITRLDELDIGDGYNLLVDFGCYHALEPPEREAYAAAITKIAAPTAILWMWAFWPKAKPAREVSADEVSDRFPEWECIDASPVSPDEIHDITARVAIPLKSPLRRAFAKGAILPPQRFQLKRIGA